MRLTGLATEVLADAALVSHIGQFEIRPSAGLRVARYGKNAAAESGAGALSLTSPEQSIVSRQTTFGIAASRPFGRFGVSASGGYQRELTDGRITTTLQVSDSAAGDFTVDGLSLARNAVTADAGVTMRLKGVQLWLGYDAKHARGETRQGIQLGLRF
jgi:Autotransporter beta-domain